MVARLSTYGTGMTRASLVKAAMVFALSMAAVTVVVTGAIFTDSQGVDGNTFTTGTVNLTAAPASAAVTFDGMVPGDKVTAPITVSNDGTVQFRYAVTSTATDADSKGLAAQLDMTVKTGVTTCSNAGFGTDGTAVYGPADLGSVAGIDVIGDPAQGAQAGDRSLAASSSEVLCIQVQLPAATGNEFQDATTTATLTFNAEQVANNP